jgi:hypothetical protein
MAAVAMGAIARQRHQAAARASGGLYTGSTYGGTYIQQQINADLRSRAEHVRDAGLVQRFERGSTSSSSTASPEPISPGMEIRAVPLVKQEAAPSYDECGICLVPFSPGDMLRVPPCSHQFHAKCLRRWFESGTPCCPCCRRVVGAPPGPRAEGSARAPARDDCSHDDARAAPSVARRRWTSLAAVFRRDRTARPRRDVSVFLDEYYS